MKKILLATTAVALSAGVAYAEVAVSGDARMGLQYTDAPAGGAAKTTIEKRMTINLDGSVESTSGITFGARMRLRSDENDATLTAGARVYMKTGGLELAMGNINGAIESMPGLYDASLGLTGLGFGGLVTNNWDAAGNKAFDGWDSYSSTGNGAEGIEVTYTAGAFTGHLSYSDNAAGGLSSNGLNSGEERVAAYGAYTMNDWTFALGLQDSDINANDKTVVTVGGKIGDYGVGIAYADNDGVGKFALNGSATFGATTVSAYVAEQDSVLLIANDMAYGLGVSYDLGGASVVGGISHDSAGVDRADLGVSFSF